MNSFPIPSLSRRAVLALGTAGALGITSAAADDHRADPSSALPADSLWQLRAPLVDQDGQDFELASLRGNPVLASMFYTSCDKVCPMIFETVHAQLRALPAAARERTRVLMVSFDPARDTPAVLRKTAQARGCDAHWRLARTDEATTRKIAALLGVQYRRLSDGEYQHSSKIVLLDSQGRSVTSTGKLGTVDRAFSQALRTAA
jgi:protein SCO1/2